jgi:hypothetical protein
MEKNLNTNGTRFGRLFATVFAAIFALGIGFIGCSMDDASNLFNGNDSDQKTGGGASTVATPTASPGTGTYTSAQNVTLGTTTEGADIYYTLDGTDPTTESTKYTSPVAIGESKTLKAIAVKADLNNSAILTAAYVIDISQVATLAASMQAGTVAAGQKVTLTTTTPGAEIRYTTNGDTPSSASLLYNPENGVIIGQDMVLKAIAIKAGWDPSDILEVAYTVSMDVAAAPTANPAGGSYHAVQSVTLLTDTEGGTIRYTLDGSDPADSFNAAAQIYTPGATIEINKTTTLKAVTGKQYLTTSQPMTQIYTLTPVAPTADLATNTYYETQTVTLTSVTDGADIYYTLDGSDPASSSTKTKYNGAIAINVSTTVKAIAVKADWTDSAVFSATYTLKVKAPTVAPAGGSYPSVQSVTLSSATGGADIYYTLDGTDPASSKTKYPTTFTIGETKTVKAIASKSGWTSSEAISHQYTITIPESSGELTAVVQFVTVNENGWVTGDSISGEGAAQTLELAIVEEPAAYFAIKKTAEQTIEVDGADKAKVTPLENGAKLGSKTASDTVALFSVNMEDLLFDGAFGESGTFNANEIPSGKETRSFALTVAEDGKDSRTITVSLNITLDKDTETSIYHREGTHPDYHYVKVRDAKLTDADKTNHANASNNDFTAFDVGAVTDLQNSFVWVDHYGEGGASNAGYANGTTKGYSEYRLFLKKSQQIGKIGLIFDNRGGDARDNMSIELYGAGTPGKKELKITRDPDYPTRTTQALNYMSSGTDGFISMSKKSGGTEKYKALVLGKNITIDAEGTAGTNDFIGSGSGTWRNLRVIYLVDIRGNSIFVMNAYSKLTGCYSVDTSYCPVNLSLAETAKFIMNQDAAITGNTVQYGVIRGSHSQVVLEEGAIITDNTDSGNNAHNGVF